MNAYEINQLASGIEVGDIVKIARTASDGERGWGNVWWSFMSYHVGNEFTVKQIKGPAGISSGNWCYPYFVLEIVKKADK